MDPAFKFAEYTLYPRERALVKGPTRIKLRRRAFDLLCILVANAGRLVDRATFLQKVWGNLVVSDEVLRVTVRELRAALHDDVKRPSFIETIARSGYRFVAPVTRHTLSPTLGRRRADRTRPQPRGERKEASSNREFVGRDARTRSFEPKCR